MDPRVQYHAFKDGPMASLSWGDPTRAVEILFLHANGLNARAYTSLLEPLGERFHVMAVDLRGHGRTGLPPKMFGYGSWKRHRDDVIRLIGGHVRSPVTLAGHGLGATVALMVAARRPDVTRGLAMVEPVFAPAHLRALLRLPFGLGLAAAISRQARAARQRKGDFLTREIAVESLAGKGTFAALARQALIDYVADGFADAPGGHVALACDPKYEARTYVAQRHDAWAAFRRAPAPIIVLRGSRSVVFPNSAARRAAALRPDARMATVDGATHMLPFERPDRARAAIEAAGMAAHAKPRDLD